MALALQLTYTSKTSSGPAGKQELYHRSQSHRSAVVLLELERLCLKMQSVVMSPRQKNVSRNPSADCRTHTGWQDRTPVTKKQIPEGNTATGDRERCRKVTHGFPGRHIAEQCLSLGPPWQYSCPCHFQGGRGETVGPKLHHVSRQELS